MIFWHKDSQSCSESSVDPEAATKELLYEEIPEEFKIGTYNKEW